MEPLDLDRISRHGIVRGLGLRRQGVPQSTIDDWADKGRLVRLHRAIFRVSGAPITFEGTLLAAVWAAGGRACHRSSAWLYGLIERPALDVAVPIARHPRPRGVNVFRLRDLDLFPIAVRNGIITMNPLQTLVHLGAVCSQEIVEAAYDAAEVMGYASAAVIEAVYDVVSARGRNGAGVLRAIIDERAIENGEPDSTLEPRMARLMRRAGLPMAVFQYWVTSTIRVDFAYPHLKLAIEVDGRASRATPEGFQRHLDRQNELVWVHGWKVIRFSWYDVVCRPAKVARDLAEALRIAGAA